MRLLDIVAAAHPEGNRIDLRWTLPAAPAFPRVRVVRRERSHPTTPNPATPADGVVLPDDDAAGGVATDTGLRGETVYYYGLFPYTALKPDGTVDVTDEKEQIDRANRSSAMATSPLGLAAEMYSLLPLIYHRYDTVLAHDPPPGMSAEDQARGLLRRFLELPGGQLDQTYSIARAALGLLDLDTVDGALLPRLAAWIGWRTDNNLELDAQRNEIRDATALYKTIGLIPVIEATVKRITGQESRTKEFVHNIATTNSPERLNLWARVRTGGVWGAADLLSLDPAFDGRAAFASDAGGREWLVYHTTYEGRTSVWSKSFTAAGGWTGSEPLSTTDAVAKDPTAARQGTTLQVFWGAYDASGGGWQIRSRTRNAGAWSAVSTFLPPEGGATVQRRSPVAVADDTGGLWLFWLELQGGLWTLKYNRNDGAAWQLNPSATLPGGQAARVEDDVFVAFHPTDAGQRLWLFWARQDPSASPGQRRWNIVYRIKASTNPAANDWGAIEEVPPGGDEHNREPAALVRADGNVELFWGSHRGGRWSVWRRVADRTTHAWGPVEDLGTEPFSWRAPVAFARAADTVLVVRATRSLLYTSAVYGATQTVDPRYSGSLTTDTRNLARKALRGAYDDVDTYVYDAGRDGIRTNDDWYARDTVGIYLSPGMDPKTISRLRQVLPELMPATDRAVFIEDK